MEEENINWDEINLEARAQMIGCKRADEMGSFFAGKDLEDKALFVAWLGELLSMTREEVVRCYLWDEDTLVIRWKGGYEKHVNIAANSRLAIIKAAVDCGEF